MSRHPSLPVLEMRNKTYLPMELVDVEPVRIKKITEEQRAAMCRLSTLSSLEYQKSINNIRQDPKKRRFEDDPFVAAWNMNIDVKMITVPGRVLPMPDIVYTKSFRVTRDSVRDVGTWEPPRDDHFHSPTPFPDNWGLINFTSLREHQCQDFSEQLCNVARQRGIKCKDPSAYYERNLEKWNVAGQIVAVVREALSKCSNCEFYVIILPSKTSFESKQAYRELKKIVRKHKKRVQL